MSTQPIITDQMRRALQAQAALTPPPVPTLSMTQPMQPLPVPQAPQVQNVPNATDLTNRRLLTDQNELRRLQTSGSGIDQITKPVDASGMPTGAPVSGLRKFGGVLARIGDIGATLALGRGAAVIPGTTQRHYADMARQQGYVNNDLANQSEQARTQQEQALTDYTLQRPDIEEAKVEQRLNAVKDRVNQAAAARGQTVDWTDPSNPQFKDDVTSQAYADHQALSAMHAATADKNKILADIQQNHYIPGTPEWEEVQRKLGQVDKRLQVSLAALGIQRAKLGVEQQNSALNQEKFYNPQPTAQERSKGDLAQSALERVQEMKQIAAKHPEWFGPVAGRAQNAQMAIGNQDPDMQTYQSAAQYLADHSAGVFGGRGQYILSQLHAITDPHSNPAAINAALDEAEKAAGGFVAAGKVHGKGGSSGYNSGSSKDPLGIR